MMYFYNASIRIINYDDINYVIALVLVINGINALVKVMILVLLWYR